MGSLSSQCKVGEFRSNASIKAAYTLATPWGLEVYVTHLTVPDTFPGGWFHTSTDASVCDAHCLGDLVS